MQGPRGPREGASSLMVNAEPCLLVGDRNWGPWLGGGPPLGRSLGRTWGELGNIRQLLFCPPGGTVGGMVSRWLCSDHLWPLLPVGWGEEEGVVSFRQPISGLCQLPLEGPMIITIVTTFLIELSVSTLPIPSVPENPGESSCHRG